jgi:hypothetical protein
MYLHLTHRVLSLSKVHLPNVPFLRNLTPLLDKGLVYKHTVKNTNDA